MENSSACVKLAVANESGCVFKDILDMVNSDKCGKTWELSKLRLKNKGYCVRHGGECLVHVEFGVCASRTS